MYRVSVALLATYQHLLSSPSWSLGRVTDALLWAELRRQFVHGYLQLRAGNMGWMFSFQI